MSERARALIDWINATHGTSYRLVSRFSAGEQGAYAVDDGYGIRAVLKWQPGDMAVRRYEQIQSVTDRLRAAGYPVPRYLLIGTDGETSYSIQTAMAGSTAHHLTPVQINRLIELNGLQRGAAPAAKDDWHDEIVQSVLYGGEEYCVIDSLRSWSPETAGLLDRMQEVVSAWPHLQEASDDIVHFDFHQLNILVDGDDITGVVDWDGLSTGRCVFDLVTLLFYQHGNPAARDLLWPAILSRAGRSEVDAYIAHLTVRQIDWTIRFYTPDFVDHFVNVANHILAESAERYSS